MFLPKEKKSRVGVLLLSIFLLLVGGTSLAGYFFIKNTNPAKLLAIPFVQRELTKKVGPEYNTLIADLPEWLGLTEPKTYLLLFLNNTELRPGGGFIGSYAVLQMNQGKAQVLQVEGTESLDRMADRSRLPAPPSVLATHLGVDRLYFRDSNWSPDFAESSRQTLALFKAENGVNANDIDAVVGVTTHVLEEIMKRTGPITVQGIEFKADTVVEKLEYEVEYGYKNRGVDFKERKQVLGELFHEFVKRLGPDIIAHSADYGVLVERLAAEKHILAYGVDASAQKKFIDYGWTGQFTPTSTDYLLWVDANLAALKTDHAMIRDLRYDIKPNEKGELIATATMVFRNTGKFDWRTTRYRTYSRVFVPRGSELISASGALAWDRTSRSGEVASEIINGHQVFGAFIAIEPGDTKTLSFAYKIAPQVRAKIDQGAYQLTVPKQLGTVAHALTLNLDFGTNITDAEPAEAKENWGNTAYTVKTDLRVDRYFGVNLK